MYCPYNCPAINHRMFVLESSGSDPWLSEYSYKAMLDTVCFVVNFRAVLLTSSSMTNLPLTEHTSSTLQASIISILAGTRSTAPGQPIYASQKVKSSSPLY